MKNLLYIFCIFYGYTSFGQNVTWADDAACIIYSHCANCHNSASGLAAFPLMSYSDAYSMRTAIKIYTQNKYMPPYLPNTDKQSYIHEQSLTQDEINLIKAWADQGAKEGNPANAPPPPTIGTHSRITFPDFAGQIPKYTIPVTGVPQYRCFVLGASFNKEKYISEFEVLPGNHSAVHHVLVYSDTSSIPIFLDAKDTAPGYASFEGTGSASAKLLYGWMEGAEAYKLPKGMGIKVEANAHIILQIVYAENAGNKFDSTILKLKFDSSGSVRPITVAPLLNNAANLMNPPLFIPADSIKTFYEKCKVDSDITLLSIAPHAHYICNELHSYAVTPQNDTIELVHIANWNVLWSHGIYPFYHPVKIPAGSIIFAEGVYNNTADNGNNPFDPPQNILYGNADTTEVMMFYFSYLAYHANDEKIIADSVVHAVHYLNCTPIHALGIEPEKHIYNCKIFPNPASEVLNINLAIMGKASISIDITEINGKRLAIIMNEQACSGSLSRQFDASALPNGNYIIRVNSNGNFDSYKLEIIH